MKRAVKALPTTTVGRTKGTAIRERRILEPLKSYLVKRKIGGTAKRIDKTVERAACHKVNHTTSQKFRLVKICRIGLKKLLEVFEIISAIGKKKKREKKRRGKAARGHCLCFR